MKWTFDTNARALYVRFVDDAAVDAQEEVGDAIVADLAADGSVVGAEMIGRPPVSSIVALIKRAALSVEDSKFLAKLALSPLVQGSVVFGRNVAPRPEPFTASRRAEVLELEPV
jgi:uncharacterized protein YuzE